MAERLGLDYVPSAFQGRIGGAKGMWMVDRSGQKLKHSPGHLEPQIPAIDDPEVWIEITDSQTKFEASRSAFFQDSSRRTFEVHAHSKPLKGGSLNYQLMPILMEGGVPLAVLERLLIEDITAESQRLKAAMNDPHTLIAYLQSLFSLRANRDDDGGVTWLGGMPDELPERIMLLAQVGP